jgi:hypothetical protein
MFCLFEELAGKDYDHFRTVADLGEDGRLAGAERERERKTRTEVCCDCDAFTNSLTAKWTFLSSRLTVATSPGVNVRPMLSIKNLLQPVKGVGVVNDISLPKREERGTMRPKSRPCEIG